MIGGPSYIRLTLGPNERKFSKFKAVVELLHAESHSVEQRAAGEYIVVQIAEHVKVSVTGFRAPATGIQVPSASVGSVLVARVLEVRRLSLLALVEVTRSCATKNSRLLPILAGKKVARHKRIVGHVGWTLNFREIPRQKVGRKRNIPSDSAFCLFQIVNHKTAQIKTPIQAIYTAQ